MSDQAFLEFVTDWDFSAIGHVAFRTARLAFVPKSAYSSSFKRLAICSGDNSCDASRRRLELLKANTHPDPLQFAGNGCSYYEFFIMLHLDCTFAGLKKISSPMTRIFLLQ